MKVKLDLHSLLSCTNKLYNMAKHLLLQELQKYSDFREQDFDSFLELFVPFTLKKGDYFYKAGIVPRHSPFIVSGCMRKFFVTDDGNEHTVYFAEEGWFAGEVQCMRMNTATEMYLQALEECDILGITLKNAEYGMHTFPAYRRFVDTRYSLDHNRIIQEGSRLKSETPENLYRKLLKERPSLILRVPQRYIANYLGIRTETISRIRNKLSQE